MVLGFRRQRIRDKGWVVVCALIFVLLSPATASAIKNGEKCPSLGASRIFKGATFQCVNSVKGRVWQVRSNAKSASPVLSPVGTSTIGGSTSVPVSTTSVKSCSAGGLCKIGDLGPGGGKVFYTSASPFVSEGSECGTDCHYLEAAPFDVTRRAHWAVAVELCFWIGESTPSRQCGKHSIFRGEESVQVAARVAARAIGMGMTNTNLAYSIFTGAGGSDPSNYAAGIAWGYSNNGKSDWHLPSSEELNQLYLFKSFLGVSNGVFWSSTEMNAYGMYLTQDFKTGRASFSLGLWPVPVPEWKLYVQPIRAF